MLVSFAHRFALIRTRKTAGTSVEMALQPLCGPAPTGERQAAVVSDRGIVGARMVPTGEATELDRTWHAHLTAAEMARRLPDWPALLKVTTVRDPFDRMVSAFHWERAVRGEGALGPSGEVRAFRAFVATGWWADDRDTVFVEGRYAPDVTLRHESLADDLRVLLRRLGAPDLPLPHAKATRGRRGLALPDYYDAPTARIVRDRHAWVFDLFGYDREPRARLDGAA